MWLVIIIVIKIFMGKYIYVTWRFRIILLVGWACNKCPLVPTIPTILPVTNPIYTNININTFKHKLQLPCFSTRLVVWTLPNEWWNVKEEYEYDKDYACVEQYFDTAIEKGMQMSKMQRIKCKYQEKLNIVFQYVTLPSNLILILNYSKLWKHYKSQDYFTPAHFCPRKHNHIATQNVFSGKEKKGKWE